jgi:hypothetical protein
MSLENCTVRAWKQKFDELNEKCPDAVFSSHKMVFYTDACSFEFWTKTKDGEYSSEVSQRMRVNDDTSYLNVVFPETKNTEECPKFIRCVLDKLDKKYERNNYKSFKEFVDSLKEKPYSEQFEAIAGNTQFRDTVYSFPNSKEGPQWFTTKEIQSLCGGFDYHNFDKLFYPSNDAPFVQVCKFPYETVANKLFKDPVRELLEQINK